MSQTHHVLSGTIHAPSIHLWISTTAAQRENNSATLYAPHLVTHQNGGYRLPQQRKVGLQCRTWDLSSNWPRRRFVKGTSPVGIKKLSSLATKWLVLNRSSSNFGSCPVPSNELRVTNSGTETSVYPCSVLPSK